MEEKVLGIEVRMPFTTDDDSLQENQTFQCIYVKDPIRISRKIWNNYAFEKIQHEKLYSKQLPPTAKPYIEVRIIRGVLGLGILPYSLRKKHWMKESVYFFKSKVYRGEKEEGDMPLELKTSIKMLVDKSEYPKVSFFTKDKTMEVALPQEWRSEALCFVLYM